MRELVVVIRVLVVAVSFTPEIPLRLYSTLDQLLDGRSLFPPDRQVRSGFHRNDAKFQLRLRLL
jgi:hypothetical protein